MVLVWNDEHIFLYHHKSKTVFVFFSVFVSLSTLGLIYETAKPSHILADKPDCKLLNLYAIMDIDIVDL